MSDKLRRVHSVKTRRERAKNKQDVYTNPVAEHHWNGRQRLNSHSCTPHITSDRYLHLRNTLS